ncbi:NAD(P) transhydrogenase subunit alpha [Flavihumibacter petaseus]|uniref:NAD(P) transhydrogenase subunit alpha part 1 n=1 Tax=Flavihumibacter petaseus NBRC 106054 TaxID=1220578 RepID=A0A0E9MZJ9_9BACT|nr:NAD(P) transhydrogenase subunit alpha [Flavihumibacter petaseus]GAO42943.1 nicotinamide nucleotide transhydrogenase alpha subunit 1 [Flavihumibacter petaseus NBRC 106054]
MIIGVLKEPAGETRVSLLPEAVASLQKKGHEIWVESGAGISAYADDDSYTAVGAKIVEGSAFKEAHLMLSIHPPGFPLVAGQILIGSFQPLSYPTFVQKMVTEGVTCFSLDMLPRTTRAQSMDVLSSQANIAGYKAVLLAAHTHSRYFPMFMTAAGSIAPAKILILGAGVAGLQAIATARRLGAVVEVFDTRPAVKEEVVSLGAKFVEVEGAADASKAGGYAVEQDEAFRLRQQEKIAASVKKADIVITTAQIPGKKAPVLVTSEMIHSMKPGSVIVDLAAGTGGNTTLTLDKQMVVENGVRIFGDSNLAAGMPSDASKLYGKNVTNFIELISGANGQVNLNWADDLVKGCCITHEHAIVHDRLKS